ncbi:hypothetical protein B0H10DRAFT_2162713 [Mycena sp. CBHHK59/15]|nr:hypothetical protein B0H10DRAFT_2162713 [Mycena sp. CBHHK59/15]
MVNWAYQRLAFNASACAELGPNAWCWSAAPAHVHSPWRRGHLFPGRHRAPDDPRDLLRRGAAAEKPPYPGPPTYEALRKWEDDLPQHNLDLPFPEGRTGRYVKFSNQAKGLGWNNCLNEELMNTHLAYMSKRAYVFQEYIWAAQHYQWPPSNIPKAGDDAPRSVSERWFDIVCPPEERRIINSTDVKPAVRTPRATSSCALAEAAHRRPERCIEVVPPPYEVDSMPQVFDLWVWGSARILPLWPAFSKSPTSRLLGPSPIAAAAVDRNAYLFLPRGPRPPHPAPRDPFARMVAMHIRRGDYIPHCANLAAWGSTYYSWAQLPFLLDSFTPAPGDDPARVDKALAHCLPTLAQIVQKVRDSRAEFVKAGERRMLDVLYFLTNEQGEWLDELKAALRADGCMAVDMELARRAAVFIGNGWSSLTSNIIHQRLVDNREHISIRLT